MKATSERSYSKYIYPILWVFLIFGSLSVIPYASYAGMIPESVTISQFFWITLINSAIIFALLCFLCSVIVPRIDLNPFQFDRLLSRVFIPGFIAGVASGLILFVLNTTVFSGSEIASLHPPFWTGLLASFYGGINEEVQLRLFLFSLVYFLFRLISKTQLRLTFLWLTNIITAFIFGLGHLPAAFQLIEPSAFEISRILILNGIPSLIFGYLFWTRGLWTCMFAHFIADIIIHVILV